MSDMLIRIDTEKAIADIEARLGMLYEKAPDVMRKSLNDTAKKTGANWQSWHKSVTKSKRSSLPRSSNTPMRPKAAWRPC